MNADLTQLLKIAKNIEMSDPQKNEQRISFAYGSAKIENENVTRDMVEQVVKGGIENR